MKLYVIFLTLLLLFLLTSTAIFSQVIEYTVKGRVVDENGLPQIKAGINLSPNNYVFPEGIFIDENGRFSIKQTHKKGTIWHLYITDGLSYSKNERELIGSPFLGTIRKNPRFIGKPIKFGDQPIIDVGDVKVQFWMVDVNMKILKNGQNLTEQDWNDLWCDLKDNQGRFIIGSTVGQNIKRDVDQVNSILKLSLPEGTWKLEFHKFDWKRSKNLVKIIGKTTYFVIDRKKLPEKINVSINKF